MNKFRQNTLDANIYGMIFHLNEYQLPDRFDESDLILDIGAHAGYFAEAVLRKGAAKILCAEANIDNYLMACQNLKKYTGQNKADIRHIAVWRSDENKDVLYQHDFCEMQSPNGTTIMNTGNGFVSTKRGQSKISKTSLDELLLELSENRNHRIRMLKIDCEGSEWPILLSSKELALVDEIHGEYHTPKAPLPFPDFLKLGPNYNSELLRKFLIKQGFSVKIKTAAKHDEEKWQELGMFYASRLDRF